MSHQFFIGILVNVLSEYILYNFILTSLEIAMNHILKVRLTKRYIALADTAIVLCYLYRRGKSLYV